MKKRIADMWVKALKSGKFKQCKGALQQSDGHCCLGVLTELYINEKGMDAFGDDHYVKVNTFTDPFNENLEFIYGAHLPEAVMEWSGVRSETGALMGGGVNLADLNDGGMKFKQIANFIKKNWRAL